jgi:GT2 family glycosyltransferase
MNQVDIIIPVHNNFDITKRCIETILDANISRIDKLILVDDHSTEGSLQEYLWNEEWEMFFYPPAETNPVKILFVKPPKRSYFSGAVNFGALYATSKYMMILNSDTKVYTRDWINIMIEEYEAEENVGILAPAVAAYFNPHPVNQKGFDNQIVGAVCWMMETEYFDSMNGLREDGKYIHWCSDFEFCERVLAQGKKVGKSSAFIQHWGGRGNRFVGSEIPRG